MGAQKFMGRRHFLGAMTQARHCVTLRWPLGHNATKTSDVELTAELGSNDTSAN